MTDHEECQECACVGCSEGNCCDHALTMSTMQATVNLINQAAGFASGHKNFNDGTATPGFFHLMADYGGIALVRVINFAGGVRMMLGGYHKPAEFQKLLSGFYRGFIEAETPVRKYERDAVEYENKHRNTTASY